MKHYLKLMRVHHYIKNLLVFAALACSGQFFNIRKLLAGFAGKKLTMLDKIFQHTQFARNCFLAP